MNGEYSLTRKEDVDFLVGVHNERVNVTKKLNEKYPEYYPDLTKDNILSRFTCFNDSAYFSGKKNEYLGCPFKEFVIYPLKNRGYSVLPGLKQKITKK